MNPFKSSQILHILHFFVKITICILSNIENGLLHLLPAMIRYLDNWKFLRAFGTLRYISPNRLNNYTELLNIYSWNIMHIYINTSKNAIITHYAPWTQLSKPCGNSLWHFHWLGILTTLCRSWHMGPVECSEFHDWSAEMTHIHSLIRGSKWGMVSVEIIAHFNIGWHCCWERLLSTGVV